MKSIEITGVWLVNRGTEAEPSREVHVLVEVGGEWRSVIVEDGRGVISHCVHPIGIAHSPTVQPEFFGGKSAKENT